MATYCIFKVYDYKGGELSSSVNLTFARFIGELAEKFESIDLPKNKRNEFDREGIKANILKKLNNRDFYSTYAGGDGFVGQMYKVEGDRMIRTSFEHHVDDITDYIIKHWY